LAHPRKAGLATIIGILTGKPTIGIAKSFLYGEIKDSYILVDGEKVGIKFGKYYASIGSNIEIESLEKFLGRIGFQYPEALKIADKLSKSAFIEPKKK
jgi:deoxyribonuclease V